MWKRVDTPYKKDHLLKTMNIEKNYDNNIIKRKIKKNEIPTLPYDTEDVKTALL